MLLEEEDFTASDRVEVRGRRAEHIRKILRAQVGTRLRVGRVNGPLGIGRVAELELGRALLEVEFEPERALPPPSPVVLAVAMCRPPTLAKVLQQGSALGVKRFEFFHCRRVEKSYWDAKALATAALRKEMSLGLEQCVDTRMPTIGMHRRFRPFAEDVLGRETPPRVRVADPSATGPATPVAEPQVIVLGPEGGFIPFELELFRERGFEFVGLGPRVLRVETAVVAALAQQALAADAC